MLAVAEAAPPLRSCAATLLELEGHGAASPKGALLRFVESLPEASWPALLARISEGRETRNWPLAVSRTSTCSRSGGAPGVRSATAGFGSGARFPGFAGLDDWSQGMQSIPGQTATGAA